MFLLLIATLGGDWSYEGFASEPARPGSVKREPAAPAPHATVMSSPAAVPLAPTPPAATVELGVRPAVAVKPATDPKSSPPKRVKADEPTRTMPWRLADVSGQVWEHANPDWLHYWVTYRNARLAASRVAPRSDPGNVPTEGACTSGRCERSP